MVKFKLEIYKALTDSQTQVVLFEERTQQDAKERMYDVFLEAAAKLENDEYTAVLFRQKYNTEDWEEVNGAPMIACVVKDGKAILTVDRIGE